MLLLLLGVFTDVFFLSKHSEVNISFPHSSSSGVVIVECLNLPNGLNVEVKGTGGLLTEERKEVGGGQWRRQTGKNVRSWVGGDEGDVERRQIGGRDEAVIAGTSLRQPFSHMSAWGLKGNFTQFYSI